MYDPGTSGSVMDKFCAVCKSVAKQKCSECKLVYYCSREHQKSDWKVHAENCRIFKLVRDPTVGRHYIATREIETDKVVICDNEPLLVIPNLAITPICLNCYAPLKAKSAKPCDKCGWPLCSECTTHGPECELTMKYRKSRVTIENFSTPNPLYDTVCVMRALALREKNPKAYKNLVRLEGHYDESMKKWLTGVIPWSVADVVHLIKTYLMIDDLEEAEIGKIIGIVGINGFKNITSKNHCNTVVFYRASFTQHDCNPNCRCSCYHDANGGAKIIIRAIKAISKGEPISITYTCPFSGTAQRRNILRSTKFFDCICERCKDPTEFGTMLSAVKCLKKECTGYMLPPTFLVSENEQIPDYACDTCTMTISSKTIEETMNEVSTKFAKIDKFNENELKKFIDEQSKILHENHYHIFKAEMDLCGLFYQVKRNQPSPSEECLKENIKLCKKLTRLMEILAPVEYATRGMILYAEFSYMTKLAEIETGRNSAEFYRWFEESKEVIIKCDRLMRYEPKKAGGGIADLARGHLKSINKYS